MLMLQLLLAIAALVRAAPVSYCLGLRAGEACAEEGGSFVETEATRLAPAVDAGHYRQLLGNAVYYEAPGNVPRGSLGSDFGWIVASNGNTLIVGADMFNSNVGQVQVFTCSGTTCTLQSTIDNPESYGFFGQGVASAGNYLAVGAPAYLNTGFVYIYDITSPSSPTMLLQIPRPESTSTQTTNFGSALAMWTLPSVADAVFIAVGDPQFNGQQGSLFFFSLNTTTNITMPMLAASDDSATGSRHLGYPVVQCDTWVATSAQGDYTSSRPVTATVYVYACTLSCAQVGNTITSPDAYATKFGYMLGFQKEVLSGKTVATLVAGAMWKDNHKGAAYVYRFNEQSQWTLMSQLLPLSSDGSSPSFGSGVTLSAGTLIVSAYAGNNNRGSVYVYCCHDGVCSDVIQVINCLDTKTNGQNDTNTCTDSGYGNNALALSSTATFLVVGARYAYGGSTTINSQVVNNGLGAVFIYSTAPTAMPTARPTNPTALPTPAPFSAPTARPTVFSQPTGLPTGQPTTQPSRADHSQAAESLLDSLTKGAGRFWFYPCLVGVVLLLCCFYTLYRRYQARQAALDKRTPYEVWVDYHDAKATGRDFVPQPHVINPVAPGGTLPGHASRNIFSSRILKDMIGALAGSTKHSSGTGGGAVGAAGTGAGASGGGGGGARRGNPGSIYDASGQKRGSAMELNDLYGRPSEEPHNYGMGLGQGMRALDRMDEAEAGPNPADLRGVSDDEVAAAAAMALAQKQISAASSKKKASATFGAYNPLIVGLGNTGSSSKKTTPAAGSASPSGSGSGTSSVSESGSGKQGADGSRPLAAMSTLYGAPGQHSSLLTSGNRLALNRTPLPQSQSQSQPSPQSQPQLQEPTEPRDSGSLSLSRGSLKVLVPTSPAAAAAGKTTYPPGTLLQSPESLHEAAIRASFSLNGGGGGGGGDGLVEDEDDDADFEDAAEG